MRSETDPTKSLQRGFWNEWNARTREQRLDEISHRQRREVLAWLDALGRRDLDLVEVGCGAVWLVEHLLPYGRVTATDLADEVLARAALRLPEARFVAGDFMAIDLGTAAFDVAVSLEVLSHVPDQPAFLRRIGQCLRPGGLLMLATQNRPILELNRIPPPAPGQLRRWVDQAELRSLLDPDFEVLQMFTVTPRARRGLLRIANSHKLNSLITPLVGDRFERFKERRGLGWTIMCLARRREAPGGQGGPPLPSDRA